MAKACLAWFAITSSSKRRDTYKLLMVGFEFHYIFYTKSGKETHFTLEYPFMPFSLELSEHVFSTKGFHTFFTRTF